MRSSNFYDGLEIQGRAYSTQRKMIRKLAAVLSALTLALCFSRASAWAVSANHGEAPGVRAYRAAVPARAPPLA